MKGRPSYDLPESMQPVIDAVGASAAVSIALTYGGSNLYIPHHKNLDTEHQLANLLGLPLAQKLARALDSPVSLPIPICYRMLNHVRIAKIIEQIDRGISAADIARQFGITSRHVRIIIARQRALKAIT